MQETTTGKVWFITSASRGFGKVWTEAVLERGDQVAATAEWEAWADVSNAAQAKANYKTPQLFFSFSEDQNMITGRNILNT